MSAFLTPLEVVDVSDTTFILLSPLLYQSDRLQRTVTVPKGFVTDFASVPRWPVVFLVGGFEANEASTLHDFLYGGSVSRADADALFAEAMEVTGQPHWRCTLMWLGVRLLGWRAYKK